MLLLQAWQKASPFPLMVGSSLFKELPNTQMSMFIILEPMEERFPGAERLAILGRSQRKYLTVYGLI